MQHSCVSAHALWPLLSQWAVLTSRCIAGLLFLLQIQQTRPQPLRVSSRLESGSVLQRGRENRCQTGRVVVSARHDDSRRLLSAFTSHKTTAAAATASGSGQHTAHTASTQRLRTSSRDRVTLSTQHSALTAPPLCAPSVSLRAARSLFLSFAASSRCSAASSRVPPSLPRPPTASLPSLQLLVTAPMQTGRGSPVLQAAATGSPLAARRQAGSSCRIWLALRGRMEPASAG